MTKHFIDVKSKECRYCGAPVAFVKSKNNKWLVVEVFCLNGSEVTYYTNQGLYPLHKCRRAN